MSAQDPVEGEDFEVVGWMPNLEHRPCLLCKVVPRRVYQTAFFPEDDEVPEDARQRLPEKKLYIKYRLCPACQKREPERAEIAAVIVPRLSEVVRNFTKMVVPLPSGGGKTGRG